MLMLVLCQNQGFVWLIEHDIHSLTAEWRKVEKNVFAEWGL